ncbi:MAG: FAD-dependent oxidoreductase, partial [Phycisphaerae bacterium]
MIEITINGRGGQGGVTLAKLIAQAYFLKGQEAQAFGVYAAERSGAPLQAFVRIDEKPITNRNQVTTPDHVIVLDQTLLATRLQHGMADNGWIILNTPDAPEDFSTMFPGRRVATIDATSIAVSFGLGTRTVPIVNTTMLGAIGGLLGLTGEDVEQALDALSFKGGNTQAARQAFACVRSAQLPGALLTDTRQTTTTPPAGLFDNRVGSNPAIRTGSWATRRPHRRQLEPACEHACPAGNHIQQFLAEAGRHDYDAALATLLETSPLPGVCGRVCPAPCMDACNRGEFDESVNIREVERYVSDHGQWQPRECAPPREIDIAVIGSGPAGLSAAYQLARLGYEVTVFDAGDAPGGVLRNGIPAYRLPRDILDREVEFVRRHGVRFQNSATIDRATLIRLTYAYSAVFVATGLQESRSLMLAPDQGGSNTMIMQGIDFLDRAHHGQITLDGERVVVIGGGNTAVDAARTALRLGARHVRIVYRRTRDEMPAIADEVQSAIDEGVQLDELMQPIRLDVSGHPALTCQRMKRGPVDNTGRHQPIAENAEGAWFELTCERVIFALGQSRNVAILPEGAVIGQDGALPNLTGAPVFCGGDFAT